MEERRSSRRECSKVRRDIKANNNTGYDKRGYCRGVIRGQPIYRGLVGRSMAECKFIQETKGRSLRYMLSKSI